MGEKHRFPEFAARFNEARSEAKLPDPQKKLGEVLGVSGVTARDWKIGAKMPSVARAVEICSPSRLNVCVEWLLTGRGPKRPQQSTDDLEPTPREILNLVLNMSPDYRIQVLAFAKECLRRNRNDIDAALKTTEKKDGEAHLGTKDSSGEGERRIEKSN